MAETRRIEREGAPHGFVLYADYQTAGRGRGAARVWDCAPGKGLLFTVLLRFAGNADIPPLLTMRAGLAVALALDELFPQLTRAVLIKWPNDIMISGRKAAGILTESDGKNVLIGTGLNIAQTREELPPGATSVIAETGGAPEGGAADLRPAVLSAILSSFYAMLLKEPEAVVFDINKRLFLRGEKIRFAPGGAESALVIEAFEEGVSASGELLLREEGSRNTKGYITGELRRNK